MDKRNRTARAIAKRIGTALGKTEVPHFETEALRRSLLGIAYAPETVDLFGSPLESQAENHPWVCDEVKDIAHVIDKTIVYEWLYANSRREEKLANILRQDKGKFFREAVEDSIVDDIRHIQCEAVELVLNVMTEE